MATSAKIEVENEAKSNADKFWGAFRDFVSVLSKAIPDIFKSIEILEGDGKAVGSILQINFGEGFQIANNAKVKVEVFDDARRTLSYRPIDGDLLKLFKHYKANFSVTPKGDGSLVKWTCEYEKATQEVPEPSHLLKQIIFKTILKVDDFILNP